MDIFSELKLRNISINECSKATGIPYGSLYPLVHGKKTLARCEYSTLQKLADFLHCDINDFFRQKENFSVYWENEKTADVQIYDNRAHIKRYSNNPAKQIFSKDDISLFELGEILSWRCWDKNRENIEKYLFKLGLTEYDPYKICRKTHGVMFQDKIWFKYDNEKLSWDDVRCR